MILFLFFLFFLCNRAVSFKNPLEFSSSSPNTAHDLFKFLKYKFTNRNPLESRAIFNVISKNLSPHPLNRNSLEFWIIFVIVYSRIPLSSICPLIFWSLFVHILKLYFQSNLLLIGKKIYRNCRNSSRVNPWNLNWLRKNLHPSDISAVQ